MDGNLFAYGTYIGPNDERYYDDNVWIGIEMANLYELTGNEVYLQHANTVWNFILEGIDDVTGGGVYWKEVRYQSIHVPLPRQL